MRAFVNMIGKVEEPIGYEVRDYPFGHEIDMDIYTE